MFGKIRKILISLKTSYNNFLVKNIDESNAIIKVEKFCKRYLILSSNSFEDYINGKQTKVRIIWSLFSRLLMILMAFKYFVSLISDNDLVQYITCDTNYLMGNPRLVAMMMCAGLTAMLILAIYIQYEEFNNSTEFFKFLQSMKTNGLKIRLNSKNKRKFGLKINLMTEYMLTFFYKSLTIFLSFISIYGLILAYLDTDSGYSLFFVLIWSLLTLTWSFLFCAIITFYLIIWYLTALFLKYKFNEINETIEMSVRTQNLYSLMNSIKTHNCVSVLTHDLNKYCKVLIFIAYYFSTPTFDLVFYASHEKSSKLHFRLLAAFLFISIFSLLFMLNILSAKIIHSAHKSLPLLYKFLVENKLSIKNKLKIHTFIERLSGPRIGLYCLNLFPMNNYELYQYIMIASMNYILILNHL